MKNTRLLIVALLIMVSASSCVKLALRIAQKKITKEINERVDEMLAGLEKGKIGDFVSTFVNPEKLDKATNSKVLGLLLGSVGGDANGLKDQLKKVKSGKPELSEDNNKASYDLGGKKLHFKKKDGKWFLDF